MRAPLHALADIAALRDHLRSAAAALALGDARAAALAGACEAWLGDETCEISLDQAFGVQPKAGQADPRKSLRLERRDGFLRAAAQLMPGSTLSARVDELRGELSKYRNSAQWQRDRILALCPYGPGTVKALLWQILDCDPNVLSIGRLCHIVGGSATKRGLFLAGDLRETGDVERSESEGIKHATVKVRNSSGARPDGGFGSTTARRAGGEDAAAPDHRLSATRRR